LPTGWNDVLKKTDLNMQSPVKHLYPISNEAVCFLFHVMGSQPIKNGQFSWEEAVIKWIRHFRRNE